MPGKHKEDENKTRSDSSASNNGDLLNREVFGCINEFKSHSKNFVIGDLSNNCNKLGRRLDDRWYMWTKEMMENTNADEKAMKDVLERCGHEEIERMCRQMGGMEWNEDVRSRAKNLLTVLKGMNAQIADRHSSRADKYADRHSSRTDKYADRHSSRADKDATIKSKKKGMITYWGVVQEDRILRSRIKWSVRKMRKTLKEKQKYGIRDYVKYKKILWDEFFNKENQKERRKA